MKKKAIQRFVLSVFLSNLICIGHAEKLEIERQTKAIPPSLPASVKEEQKNDFFAFSFYETSDVKIGRNKGKWSELTSSAGYKYKGISSYFSYSRLDRRRTVDHTFNVGSYFKIKDFYVHEEIGFGADVSYIYKFQNIAELSHKLYKSLYWQISDTYRDYKTNDSQLISPGLTCYFGNHYVSASYGMSHVATRGTANLGTLKGDFEITDWLRWNAGATYGQWLYDIQGKDASDEVGYILNTGFNLKIYKDFHIGAGYSYGTEKPKFIIRSINVFASIKF